MVSAGQFADWILLYQLGRDQIWNEFEVHFQVGCYVFEYRVLGLLPTTQGDEAELAEHQAQGLPHEDLEYWQAAMEVR